MVYYNPRDAQYLSYLVVEYDEETYAAKADPYYGYVYALEAGERQIVYVELIFCNYFMDLDYKEMIPAEYLPTGFDAAKGNAYRKQMLGEQE